MPLPKLPEALSHLSDVGKPRRAVISNCARGGGLVTSRARLYRAPTMSDPTEIPEAATAFEKKIALTIAILAVILSFVNNKGDNAKTDAIIKTNLSSDKWAQYQSKSIKGHVEEMHAGLLRELGGPSMSDEAKQSLVRLTGEVQRLNSDKEGIKKEAKDLEAQADKQGNINDRCDLSALLLQIGIVICSVAILSSWKPFWYIGIALGIAGGVIGVTAFLM
jgi:hypothetical protein